MRIQLRDRYIQGTAAFEDLGDKAALSYVNKGLPKLPINSKYEIEGKSWRVAAVNTSDYNSYVINVDLELING